MVHAAVVLGILTILSLTSLFVGVGALSPLDLLHPSPIQLKILYISRIPRLISILISGAGLGIAGMIMQQLARNKFVSPTTAGTMDAARLGILFTLLYLPNAGILGKTAISFAFSLAGTFLFMQILNRVTFKDAVLIPLIGLMFGNVVGAITTFIAYERNMIQTLSTWLFGDFSMILKGRYEILYVNLPLIAIAYTYAHRITIAGMGEDFAANLGLRYRHVVNVGLVIVASISAAVTLTVGSLPFLGLIVPNIVSMYRGDNMRRNLPHVALLGATLVLACDVLGRVIIYPYEISVGLTMGVLGSGLFLLLLLRRDVRGA